jgi:hypothetical protein
MNPHVAWSRGSTKETDKRLHHLGMKVRLNASRNSKFGNRGHHFTQEHRDKLTVAHTGKHYHTVESRRKISLAKIGIRYPASVNKKKGLSGIRNPFFGRKHTKETRSVISMKIKQHWTENRERLLRSHKAHLGARLHGLFVRPTSFESAVIGVIEDFAFPFKYTGDGRFVIDGLNPDFVSTDGSSSLIEVYAKYWHPADYESVRKSRLESHGFNVMFLNEEDIRCNDFDLVCAGKILSFIGGVGMNRKYWIEDSQIDEIMDALETLRLGVVCDTLRAILKNQFIGEIETPKKQKVCKSKGCYHG